MEKKGNNSCPMVLCEKVYKKASPFQAIRRLSHHFRPFRYASSASNSSGRITDVQSGEEEASGIVPISFEYSNHTLAERIPKNKVSEANAKEKSGVPIEERVTEYLNRAKSKMRKTISMSNQSAGKAKKNQASGSGNNDNAATEKDLFADFIERTKKKFSTTSSMSAAAKRNSFK